jgi:hypothetical protein
MATYTVNRRAVAYAKKLIDAGQYVLRSDWGNVQPGAAEQNAFLKNHKWVGVAAQERRARGAPVAAAPRQGRGHRLIARRPDGVRVRWTT